MSQQNRCGQRRLVDDHFAGAISPRAEQQLREHLPGCDGCRAYYERHLMLAELDPKADSAEERLARGLGLGSQRPGSARRWLAAASAAAAAAAVLVLVIVARSPAPDDAFQPRGGGSKGRKVELLVYRLQPGKRPELVKETIARGDELAFAYRNGANRRRLMVFAVDEHRNVYWFHPAWRDPARDPGAVPIRGGDGLHELKEAVGHDYRGRRLRIYALFVNRALRVREVEAEVRRAASAQGKLHIDGALRHTRSLIVDP